MNRIDTIEAAADTLALTSITFDPKRCSYIRNWNSTCRMCLDVCQHDAITRSVGHLNIDSEACTQCGACVSACPTSTFLTTAPTMNRIVEMAREQAQHVQGNAVFACTRQIELLNIDARYVVALPCLNYLDEYTIVGLFATDVENVVLFRGECEGCDIDCAEPYIDTVVRSVKRLLKLWHIPNHVKVYKTIPDAFILEPGKKQRVVANSDKREAFQEAGTSMKGYLFEAASDIMGNITGTPKKQPPDKNKQVIVHLDEMYPPESYRSIRMLRMLDYLGQRPYGSDISSRFWTNVDIDEKRCRHCGACATMCVTRALQFEETELPAEKPGANAKTVTLTFQPSLCVGCRLCKDGCLTRSMHYESTVPADDLDADVVRYLLEDAAPDKRKSYF